MTHPTPAASPAGAVATLTATVTPGVAVARLHAESAAILAQIAPWIEIPSAGSERTSPADAPTDAGSTRRGAEARTGAATPSSSPTPLGEDAAARPSPAAVAPPAAAATPSPPSGNTASAGRSSRPEVVPARTTSPPSASPAGSQASPALSKRDRFRALWAEGKSAGEIAAAMGWKRTTVYTEAYKLKLPRRWLATPDESREAIAHFIERHGVEHCPVAYAAPVLGAQPSEEDRKAHQARGIDPLGDAWRAKQKARRQ